jgi:hypothetical protein
MRDREKEAQPENPSTRDAERETGGARERQKEGTPDREQGGGSQRQPTPKEREVPQSPR